MPLSDFDRANVEYIMTDPRGEANWFTAQLLRLIAKADVHNRARLRLGFPEEVELVERYERGEIQSERRGR